MTTKQRVTFDPATLAASVRDVAIEARRLLKDSAREPYEVGALTQRIHILQGQAQGCSTGDLSRWLENLSREVESDANRGDRPRRKGLDRSDEVGIN
jgi:hypothetical protein